MKFRLKVILAAALFSAVPLALAQDAATDVKKGADDTGSATKKVATKTAHGTEKAADKTGHATKVAAKNTAKGVKSPPLALAESVGNPGTILILVDAAFASVGSEFTLYTVSTPLLPLPLVK